MTRPVPDFSIDDVLEILQRAYSCQDVGRVADFIAIVCANGRGTVLRAVAGRIADRDLSGALAVLEIDFREFLTHLAARRRGDGADADQP